MRVFIINFASQFTPGKPPKTPLVVTKTQLAHTKTPMVPKTPALDSNTAAPKLIVAAVCFPQPPKIVRFRMSSNILSFYCMQSILLFARHNLLQKTCLTTRFCQLFFVFTGSPSFWWWQNPDHCHAIRSGKLIHESFLSHCCFYCSRPYISPGTYIVFLKNHFYMLCPRAILLNPEEGCGFSQKITESIHKI